MSEPTTQSAYPKLEQAYLMVLPPGAPGTGGGLGGGGGGGDSSGGGSTVNFRFNPTQYKVAKTATWKRTNSPGAAHAGAVQWGGAGPRKMTLDLFMDESDSTDGDITADCETLFSCCEPTTATQQSGSGSSGPYVLFGWGSVISFTAILTGVTVTYTMFHPDGTPFRAKVNLTMEEVDAPPPAQNPTSGTLETHRTRTLLSGDTLPLISYQEYGDPSLWRVLAEANGIDDPLRLRAGTAILVPRRPTGALRT